MKSFKMFGLATFAALIAMAFIGASSAMAEETQLCIADSATCASPVMHVHETTLAGSKATLLNSVGNVSCDVLFLSTSVGSLAAPQIIKGNFTYSNCLMGSTKCTVTEKNGPAEIRVLKEGHETAKVTGEGEVNVKCAAFINCTYNNEGLIGTFQGPLLSSETNGSVLVDNQATNKVSGFLCPETAKLDITTTPLSPTYIPEPILCIPKVNGDFKAKDFNPEKCLEEAPGNGSFEIVKH